MKSFQPKAEGSPPDDERPDDPPTPSIDPDNQPTQSKPEPETEPMPRSNHRTRNAEVDFKGEKRSNATHASTTDPTTPPADSTRHESPTTSRAPSDRQT